MKIVSLPKNWRGRALVISAVSDPASWFGEAERAVIESFSWPRRRMEWMLSRIAEKELRNRGAHGEYISYSHSLVYGGAAIDAEPVGIDVQTLRDISEAAAHHFLNDAEIDALRTCSIAHRLLHFWCAKEAVWKQRRGEVATLKRVPLTLIDEDQRGLRFTGVETWAVADLVAALTLPSS